MKRYNFDMFDYNKTKDKLFEGQDEEDEDEYDDGEEE